MATGYITGLTTEEDAHPLSFSTEEAWRAIEPFTVS
jgi:hypothetical protein